MTTQLYEDKNMKIQVPFNDLHAQYLTLKDKIDSAIVAVIKESAFVRGPYVNKFEKEFAELFGVENCISCANGTDALYIAMRALGVKNGDEVIAPCHSWISTTETISQAGGCVVFCNTDKDTYTIDIDDIELKITDKTVGIVPVHLYGQPADMDPIIELAIKHNLWVLEDCAQAHLAKYKGRLVGTFGDAATFSFYPGKNLGAYGDGGIITTNSKKRFNVIKKIRNLGSEKKFKHDYVGVNSRLDTIQAIILNKKLTFLKNLNKKRKKIAELYDNKINNKKITKLKYSKSCVYHQYVILVKQRKKLIKVFNDKKIQYGFHYPKSINQLDVFKIKFKRKKFCNAERMAKEGISIPIDPNLSNKDINIIIKTLNEL